MSREGKLAKSTAIYFIGSFGSKILSFLLIPIYANYLTEEAYGNYDLINTIIQIAYPAITLMLDNALYVYLIGTDDEQRKNDIIAYAIRTLFCNGIIAILICVFANFIYHIQYVEWVITWLITYSVYTMWIQLCRGMHQQKLYSLTGIIVTAITLIGNIVGLVVLKQDYRFLMISNCLAYIVSIIFLESKIHAIRYWRKGRPTKNLKNELLKYAVPLLPNQLSWWILNVSDRIMLVFFLGAGANGLYAMACKIPAILNVVHSIFASAWSDDILSATDMRETEKYASRIYNMYIKIMIGIAIVLITGNRLIFRFIVGGNFKEAYHYTYFLYIGFIFGSIGSLLGAFYGYYKKSLNVSLSTILAALVNFLINILFMKQYGIQVASISTCVGSIVIWLVRLVGLRGLVEIKISTVNKLLLLLLIPFYYIDRIEGVGMNLFILSVGCILAIIINVKTVKDLGTIILKRLKKRG